MASRRHGIRALHAFLLAALAFTACWLVSASAWASGGLGACSSAGEAAQPAAADADESSAEPASTFEVDEPELLMTPNSLAFLPPTPGCTPPRRPDAQLTGDADDDASAPMCDPSGASVLAPRVLQAVEDSRLEAPRPCPDQHWLVAFTTSSDPGHADAAPSKHFMEAATLPTPLAHLCRAPAESALTSPDTDELPDGHRRGLDRPPTG